MAAVPAILPASVIQFRMTTPVRSRKERLRKTLRLSQQEAVASATMTGTSDNYLNAFAVYMQASVLQMGWLNAVPQLFGALWQIGSVWLGGLFPRKPLVVATALLQSAVVALMAVLALGYGLGWARESSVFWLILLSIGYFSCLNLIQPHWRAWMGGLVPARRRGVFFARRTRLTMIASLLIFVGGGGILALGDSLERTWLGFGLLFGVAALGRLVSSWLLGRMHDPVPAPEAGRSRLADSWRHVRESMKDPTFRHYSVFVAFMQGAVAVSAPFFSVYMLRDLNFSYLEFSVNNIASIATQFSLLHFWGRFSDRFGNHLVMVLSSCIIPVLPLLWLLSPDFFYLLLVQVISGFAWSGFTLSTANYLYDIRPHHTNFALYAAIQSGSSALLVFAGAILGGYVANHAEAGVVLLAPLWEPASLLFVVFLVSAILRMAVAAFFIPRLQEPQVRRRPRLLELIFRVARFNAVTGVSLDYMSVTRKSGEGDEVSRDESGRQ